MEASVDVPVTKKNDVDNLFTSASRLPAEFLCIVSRCEIGERKDSFLIASLKTCGLHGDKTHSSDRAPGHLSSSKGSCAVRDKKIEKEKKKA